MRKGRLIALSLLSATCVGLYCLAGPNPVYAASAAGAKLGPPYEAGGMWFVPAADPSYDAEGTAAEYGAGQAGRLTVSGERFDPKALTAAHATLPMPGVVEVTNLDTGKVVTLRINDRGPYVPGRILSLTPASAKALGVAPGQAAHVRVRYADAARRQVAAAVPARENATTSGGYGVQVGAFSERGRADQVAARASAAGHARVSPVERGGATLYRVVVGAFGDARAAEAARGELSGLGFDQAKVVPAL